MDITKLPDSVPKLSITPGRIEIVLADDPKNALSFVSDPIDDINEMSDFSRSVFSLHEVVDSSGVLRSAAAERMHELQRRLKRFAEAPTFLNRIANLQGILGNHDDESATFERAYDLTHSSFFARKLGEAKTKSGDIDGARHIFEQQADSDSYSALRLASFGVIEGDNSAVWRWLAEAIQLNPAGYAERLFQGAFCLMNGDARSAVSYLRIALDARPNSSVAYSNLGLAYLSLHRPDKAYYSLKKSVALDPFNRSALVALADVANSLGRDREVLPYLKYFVEFEQKSSAVWGRFARSLLRLDFLEDCIHALKRQGALESSVEVWNNLGVAYAKQGKTAQGFRALKHAISLVAERGFEQELLVARNSCVLVSQAGNFDVLLTITSSIIEQDIDREIARLERFSDIYSMHMHALMKIGRQAEAFGLADQLMHVPEIADELARWIVTTQAAVYGLERNEDGKLTTLLDSYSDRLGDSALQDVRLINNLAFGYAEMGRLVEAISCISKVSGAVHKDPYITATLGLINLRKGRLERGEQLYRDAVLLARTEYDKTRIKQKLNVELGRAYMERDSRKGRGFLKKAAEERRGESALAKQASRMLTDLDSRLRAK